MALNSLRDLYVEHIQDLYSAEQQIIKALPKMIEKTSHGKLRDGFTHHLEQTRQHAHRLEEIAHRLEIKADGKTCKGMAGLLAEGEEVLKEDADPDVRDAALISAAQRVEHYEIAAYGCARNFAEALGRDQDVSALQRTLDEEGDTDKKLTQLADSVINPDAEKSRGVDRDRTPRAQREPGATRRPDDEARA